MRDKLWLPDQGDGTYRNPVLFCDYSDPDVIRVGNTWYMTASSFNYVPGLPILTSKDLVNWTLGNYALPNIPDARYHQPCHAQGVWAPAIRWQKGVFYIFYGMPDEGIFMIRTADPLGRWDDPVCVLQGKGLIDPCPFWDDDGRAWVVHGYAKSRIGFKSRLGIFPMSHDGTHAIGDDHLLYDGTEKHPTIEGPKVHKRDGWYYIFAPAGGVATGWQTVLRSRSLLGPYEDRVVLKQGSTEINGPHQGAWVDAPDGTDWFLHFQSRGLYGRIIHLEPMRWQEDGWPFIGVTDAHPVPPESIAAGEDAAEAALHANAADCGVPVMTCVKPNQAVDTPVSQQGSDDFAGNQLGLQWQFMGNWRESFYSLSERPGYLRLHALPGETLWQCAHALTQKIIGPAFMAQTTLDASGLRLGEEAGLGLVGGQYAYLALRREEGGLRLVYVFSEGAAHTETVVAETAAPSETIALRMHLIPTGYCSARVDFAWSTDGVAFRPIGQPFEPARHTWVGVRLALFAIGREGWADFGPFAVAPVEADV